MQLSKRQVTDVNQGDKHTLVSTNEYGAPQPLSVGVLPTNMTPDQAAKIKQQGSELEYRTISDGKTTRLIAVPKIAGGAAPGVVGQWGMQLTPQQEMANNPEQQAALAGAKGLTAATIADYKAQHTKVQNIPDTIRHVDQVLGLLTGPDGKPLTGMGQTWQLNLDKAAQLTGMSKNDLNGMSEAARTELLNKKLNEIIVDSIVKGGSASRTAFFQNTLKSANAGGNMEPGAIRQLMMDLKTDMQEQVGRHNQLAGSLMTSPALGHSMRVLNMGPMDPVGVPPEAIAELKANPTPQMRQHFDEAFHQPGAAAHFLGGTPTGGAPFKGLAPPGGGGGGLVAPGFASVPHGAPNPQTPGTFGPLGRYSQPDVIKGLTPQTQALKADIIKQYGIVPTSEYRTHDEQAGIRARGVAMHGSDAPVWTGGVDTSSHRFGTALDVPVPPALRARFKADMRARGLRAYDEGTHVHVDDRTDLPNGPMEGK